MELLEFVTYLFEQLAGWGSAGFIIVILLAVIVILWHSLKAERERSQILADEMYAMTKETTAMIERISGR